MNPAVLLSSARGDRRQAKTRLELRWSGRSGLWVGMAVDRIHKVREGKQSVVVKRRPAQTPSGRDRCYKIAAAVDQLGSAKVD